MSQTKRQRKRDQRQQRELAREIEQRRSAGEPILLLHMLPDTKSRPPQVFLGEPVDTDSDYAKRLAKARAFLDEWRLNVPPNDPA